VHRYRLVEFADDLVVTSEEFPCDDDGLALDRALEVVENGTFELWRGRQLVARHTSDTRA